MWQLYRCLMWRKNKYLEKVVLFKRETYWKTHIIQNICIKFRKTFLDLITSNETYIHFCQKKDRAYKNYAIDYSWKSGSPDYQSLFKENIIESLSELYLLCIVDWWIYKYIRFFHRYLNCSRYVRLGLKGSKMTLFHFVSERFNFFVAAAVTGSKKAQRQKKCTKCT